MFVKPFVSKMIIDLLYLNNYIQYKHFLKLVVYKNTAITLYRLDWNENFLKMFAYPTNNRAIYRPEVIL